MITSGAVPTSSTRRDLNTTPATHAPTLPGPWVRLWLGDRSSSIELGPGPQTTWLRTPNVSVSSNTDVHSQWELDYLEEEWRALLQALLMAMPAMRCINSLSSTTLASNRPTHLVAASRVGFQVPPWVVTNRDQRVPTGDLVVKRLSTRRLRLPEEIRLYTGAIEPEDLQSSDFTGGVSLLQRRVLVRDEVRVTVFGSRVFSHRLVREHIEDADYRQRQDDSAWQVVALPTDLEIASRALVSKLGLEYGAIDLAWDGTHHQFLEINPSGEYRWLDEISEGALTEAMLELLLRDTL